MRYPNRIAGIAFALIAALSANIACGELPKRTPACWNVDDLKEGMTGYGVTCLQGTRLEKFEVVVLGVLKNQSPGRDAVLAKLSGLGLEKTGVIGGMSGSPVYIQGKLVGAVAFTWAHTKDPICGITPFSQMLEYAKPLRSPGRAAMAVAVDISNYRLDGPMLLCERSGRIRAAQEQDDAGEREVAADGRLVPIATPIAATGFSTTSLDWLQRYWESSGGMPVQAGGRTRRNLGKGTLEAGGPLAVGLVTGDVALTGVGTVTAVAERRVYGFGHPFMSLGDCELPLLDAYIHAVIPKQTISTKIGSALQVIGRITADVSTCIAGELGDGPDLLPTTIRVKRPASNMDRTFQCQMVRDPTMLGMLATTALSSCVDMEGQQPCELTTKLKARVELEGFPPLVCEDLYSGFGYSGSNGLLRTFVPLGNLLTILAGNPYHRPRIVKVECEAEIVDERRSARVVAARPARKQLEPGEPLRVIIVVEPYRSRCGQAADPLGSATAPERREIELTVELPADLTPGRYRVEVGDSSSDLRQEFSNRRHLNYAESFDDVYALLLKQLAVRRTQLVARVNLPKAGMAVKGTELPSLPAGVAQTIAADARNRTFPVVDSALTRMETQWFIEGSASATFEVVDQRGFFNAEPNR